jgi:Ca2+-binding RTX toxin-like protein
MDGSFEDDQLQAGGSDTLIGGAAEDLLRTRTPTEAPKRMDGGFQNDVLIGSDDDDRMFGDIGDDVFEGNGGNDEIHGEDSNDRINGGDGNDTLFGEDGEDDINGGAGADVCDGGGGNGDKATACETEKDFPRYVSLLG